MTKEKEVEIREVFSLMVKSVANKQKVTFGEKVADDLGITDDEEYEILHVFIKDCAIGVDGYVAKTKSLVIYDDTVAKKLDEMNNLENEVCFSKSLDIKEGMAENMVSMITCKVWREIEINTFDYAIIHSMNKEYEERPYYIQPF